MPQGLQIWNADGSVQLDTSIRTGVELGSITFTAAGSAVVPKFALGEPFFLLNKFGLWDTGIYTKPVVSISGTTISWTASTTGPWQLSWGVR